LTDDGSRPLPEPIDLGSGRRLTTLRDVEIHLLTLTPAQRTLRSWQGRARWYRHELRDNLAHKRRL